MALMLSAWLACTQEDPDDGSDATSGPGTDGTTDTDTDSESDTDVPSDTGPAGPTEPTTTDGTVTLGTLVFDVALPKNLLMVSLDTTRRDVIGRFDGGTDTPELDAFLEGAVVLEEHRSCSNWTGPSMTCAISGRTPLENGFWPWSFDPQVRTLPPPDYKTLASHLTTAGWSTTIVTANEVFSSDIGLDPGYQREVRQDWVPAPWVADSALVEVDTLMAGDAPWFLHVHFIDPHGGYCAPEEYIDGEALPEIGVPSEQVCDDVYAEDPGYLEHDEPWQEGLVELYRELYRGEVRYWDKEFGEFLVDLDARGALDDTLVVFLTDHGQQFYERGNHGHGIALGSEENRAVAAFWAKNLHPGVWSGPTLHQDLTETLFRMYGVQTELPTSGLVVGTAPSDRAIRSMDYRGGSLRMSVVKNDRQLLYDWWGEHHYYRLDTDPGALQDVYDPADPEVVDLWAEMEAFAGDIEATWTHLPTPNQLGP